MPTRTVGAYIEHEQKWRGRKPATERQLRREWREKTPTQRNNLARRIVDAQSARDSVRAQEQVAQAAFQRFDEEHGPWPDTETERFRELLQQAINAWAALGLRQQAERDAWSTLWNEQQEQGAVQQSLDNTERLFNEATARRAGRSWNSVAKLRQLRDQMDRPPVPAFQGRRKVRETWISANRRKHFVVRRLRGQSARGALGLRKARPAVGVWHAQRTYEGGQATVSLWLQLDASDRIVDRCARKEQYYDNKTWFDARKFDGDVKQEKRRTPWEIATHGAVDNILTLTDVVHLQEPSRRRTWIDNTLRRHLLYLEWCPHGDLGRLIERLKTQNRPTPEPLIWYFAEAFARCALAFETGQVDHNVAGPFPNWTPIVHRDLNPRNIFLARPDVQEYPFYPKPLVADFGYGIRTSDTDDHNPEWLMGVGTETYRSPESISWVDRDTLRPIDRDQKILGHTDIFGFGLILWYMVRQEDPKQALWLGDGDLDQTYDWNDAERGRYTPELLGLIEDCLEFRPVNRVNARDMLNRVITATRNIAPGGGVNPHLGGMGDNGATVAQRAAEAVDYGQDAYRLGLDRGQLVDEL